MSSRISPSLTRGEESSDSVTTSSTEGESTSSAVQEPSVSPTSVSQGRGGLSDGDDIEPSESASRGGSRAPTTHKSRQYGGASRDSSRHRAPAPDPPIAHRTSQREHREHSDYRHHRHHRHEHGSNRRRPRSVHSDSVESYDDYGGRPRSTHPTHYRHSQWAHVQPQQPVAGYAASSIASQPIGPPLYNAFTNPGAAPGSLVPYQHYDPHLYYASAGHMPPHAPVAPSPISTGPPSGYFATEYHRPHPGPIPMMSYPYYPIPMHPGQYVSPPPSSPQHDDSFTKLQELLIAQEQARVVREETERRAKMEAEQRAADAKAAKEALEEAAKKAKESAEAAAAKEKKQAQEDYDKKLDAAKKAKEEAEEAVKKAKEAEDAAKKEAAAAKPSKDDLKGPITFKDAVGRKFVFPWKMCKTWKGTEELIRQAFIHVDVLGEHVLQGHYDLMGPNGEIILPHVWESTIQPDWSITMHMWPMEEKKKVEPKPITPAASPLPATHDRSVFGRKKSKRKKETATVIVPPPPPGVSAGPPPPPPDGVAVVSDTDVAVPSAAASSSKDKRKSKALPPMLAWTANSMGVRRTKSSR